ncbi:hypothetical protein LCGC14_0902180 [marine sediment metagenome]|uniref:Uncharacterized protein n=1 Tax=marine sediment metagenome TaxID=412755 RepID=A0A0F9PGU1_9ZZZZ
MAQFASDWKTATLDFDRSSEFTGDDVDQFSSLVDLGEGYEYLSVFIPALSASGTVSVWAQRDAAIATVPMVIHILDDDATGSFLHATSSGDGDIYVIFRIGGARYVRIRANADQTANRLFQIKGFNRQATV